jgi:hypothetical protein
MSRRSDAARDETQRRRYIELMGKLPAPVIHIPDDFEEPTLFDMAPAEPARKEDRRLARYVELQGRPPLHAAEDAQRVRERPRWGRPS